MAEVDIKRGGVQSVSLSTDSGMYIRVYRSQTDGALLAGYGGRDGGSLFAICPDDLRAFADGLHGLHIDQYESR